MASRPDTKFAVRISPLQGDPVLVLVDSSGAANALVSQLTENSDASALNEGAVYELPMAISHDLENSDAVLPYEAFSRDFRRATTGRKLLDVRSVERIEDESGVYWRAIALWAFEERPKAVVAEASAVVAKAESLLTRDAEGEQP